MSVHLWSIYVALVLAATATPGPAVLFVMTSSAQHGWQKTLFAILGNITGLLCLGGVAIAGLGAILSTSAMLFNAIKYLGAAYLIYIGLKLFFMKPPPEPACGETNIMPVVSPAKLYFQALAVSLSNPKAIGFLTALFPQFIDTNQALVPQFTVLITVLIGFSILFLMLYSLAAHTLRAWLRRSNRIRMFNRISGSVFIGFGLALAAASNRFR